ncbi:MAG: AbrB/MazE/SpoVT family DNA-binding domain-containing protein [Nanoarchaeota archaeon]
MIAAKTRKWGNSLGIIIPKEEVENLNLRENQTVIVEITKKENPLKELFGFGKGNKITKEDFLSVRKLLEPKI